jgi:hypothetical protein
MSTIATFRQSLPDPLDDLSLPGWLYHDPEYFEVEMARLIRPAWQIVCHESDIPNPGDWRTLDYLGESVIVIRGEDIRTVLDQEAQNLQRIMDQAGAACWPPDPPPPLPDKLRLPTDVTAT